MAFIEELQWWLLRPWYSDENFLRGVNCPLFIPQHGLGFPHPLWRKTLVDKYTCDRFQMIETGMVLLSNPPFKVHCCLFFGDCLCISVCGRPILRKYLIWYFQAVLSSGCSALVLIFSCWSFFMLMMVMSGADGGGGHFITINFQASGLRCWQTGHWFSASHQKRRTTLLSSGTFLLIQPDVWSWAER